MNTTHATLSQPSTGQKEQMPNLLIKSFQK